MSDSTITVRGYLGGDVTLREAGDVPVASFRLACTPRRYQRSSDSWVDGATQWYSVDAWRALGENCRDSLRRGDPVVVHGRLEAHVWTNNAGVEVRSFVVEASSVGHDLNRGVSRFAKNVRPEGAVRSAEQSTETREDAAAAPAA